MAKHAGSKLLGRSAETISSAKILRQKTQDWTNAYYLSGLAVEHTLWALRCKAAGIADADFQNAPGHNLNRILLHTGVAGALDAEMRSNRILRRNWAVVRGWDSNARFGLVQKALAEDLFAAATDARNGVLPWLREIYQRLR